MKNIKGGRGHQHGQNNYKDGPQKTLMKQQLSKIRSSIKARSFQVSSTAKNKFMYGTTHGIISIDEAI